MSDEAVEIIKRWLKEMTDYEEDNQDNNDDSDSNTIKANNAVDAITPDAAADDDNYDEDISVTPHDVINNDTNVDNIVDARINDVPISAEQFFDEEIFTGTGSLSFVSGNYFVGEFSGSVMNREGVLTRVNENGLKTTGTWKNGLLEVRLRDY